MKTILVKEFEFMGKFFLEIILNRPQLRNAFDPLMIKELTQTFKELNNDFNFNNNKTKKKYRAVILRGAGKVFCAGADLQWMESMVKYSYDENEKDALVLFEMFESLLNCSIPLIGIVHGAAMGGALGLLATCDIVLAEEKTQFCFSEVKLGIAPAVISAFIKRKISGSLVDPWMISGRVFDSQFALKMGLAHEVFSGDSSQLNCNQITELQPWLKSFVEAAPQAVIETKKIVNSIAGFNWNLQKKITSQLIAQRRVSDEGQEGLNSFLKKLNPSWR